MLPAGFGVAPSRRACALSAELWLIALPCFSAAEDLPVVYPGASSADCLTLGCRATFDGAVRVLLAKARAFAAEAPLFLTGGESKIVKQACQEVFDEVDLLPLGLAFLAARTGGRDA